MIDFQITKGASLPPKIEITVHGTVLSGLANEGDWDAVKSMESYMKQIAKAVHKVYPWAIVTVLHETGGNIKRGERVTLTFPKNHPCGDCSPLMKQAETDLNECVASIIDGVYLWQHWTIKKR
jgi:hypothetical protein